MNIDSDAINAIYAADVWFVSEEYTVRQQYTFWLCQKSKDVRFSFGKYTKHLISSLKTQVLGRTETSSLDTPFHKTNINEKPMYLIELSFLHLFNGLVSILTFVYNY